MRRNVISQTDEGGDSMAKDNILVGKIQSSGVQQIKPGVSQNKKTGKSTVKRGDDLRTKK